jgi:hypothetical protein
MKRRRISFIWSFLLLAALLIAARDVQAAPILETGLTTFVATGTEFGRLTRNGVPSDWSTSKPFPGVTGAPAIRGYELFTVNAGPYPFLQILLDDPLGVLFVSAYLGAFTPLNLPPNYGLDLNYLGDAGLTQPIGNPSFFQIVVAPFTNVRVPIVEVNPGGGTGAPFNLIVEGFYDTEYNDTPIPEPASLILVGSGALLGAIRRKKL